MVIVRNADGHVVVLAKEFGIGALERVHSKWQVCSLTGEALQDFVRVSSKVEVESLLDEARSAARSLGIGTSAPATVGVQRGIRFGESGHPTTAAPNLAPNKD